MDKLATLSALFNLNISKLPWENNIVMFSLVPPDKYLCGWPPGALALLHVRLKLPCHTKCKSIYTQIHAVCRPSPWLLAGLVIWLLASTCPLSAVPCTNRRFEMGWLPLIGPIMLHNDN